MNWRPSNLVQRLAAPTGIPWSPFTFGGGLLNGGLRDEAVEILGRVFSFEYMGSAHFEDGSIPRALHGLALDRERLGSFAVLVDPRESALPWYVHNEIRRKRTPKGRDKVLAKFNYPFFFYAIARSEHRDLVEGEIRRIAKDPKATLEPACLTSAIFREKELRTKGWLELDNGYFFFADHSMFKATAEIFGVAAVPEVS